MPTRTAAELLKAKPVDRMTEKQFDAIWVDLLQNTPYSSDPVAITRGLLALVNAPESAGMLKVKLPAIKASKEQVTKWLKALDSDDEKVWKAAVGELFYTRPALVMNWREQCQAVTTDRGRSVVFGLASPYVWTLEYLDMFSDCVLEPCGEDGLTMLVPDGRGGRQPNGNTPGKLSEFAALAAGAAGGAGAGAGEVGRGDGGVEAAGRRAPGHPADEGGESGAGAGGEVTHPSSPPVATGGLHVLSRPPRRPSARWPPPRTGTRSPVSGSA
jgi:hypothetical protein